MSEPAGRSARAGAELIAVTGATGAVGGRVARRLAEVGAIQRLVVRDPARAPRLIGAEVVWGGSYGDGDRFERALEGAQTLFLVSASEAADRVALQTAAVDAALRAGVTRIVYLSFLSAAPDATFTFARDHHATEEHIRSTGVAFTFLRSSMYLDFVPRLVSASGELAGPGGDGRVAWVARDDVAAVATAVLTAPGHDGQTYDVTGSEAHGFAYAAEELARRAGRPIVYVNESVEQAYASRASYGAPAFEVDGWVSSYLAVAAGDLDVVSDVVFRLTGRSPQTLADYLDAHPDEWAHLRGG